MSEFGFTESVGFAVPVDDPVELVQFGPTIVTPALGHSSPVMDVRAFNTIYLRFDGDGLGGATWAAADVMNVSIAYYADPAGTILTYQEEYLIYSTSLGGFPGSGPLQFVDNAYGPYAQLTVFEEVGAGRTLRLDYQIFGSYRLVTNIPRARCQVEPNGTLYRININLGGAGVNTSKALVGYGRALVSLQTGAAAAGATLAWTYAGATLMGDSITVAAANTRVNKEIILPKKQAEFTLTNLAAGAAQLQAYMILQL